MFRSLVRTAALARKPAIKFPDRTSHGKDNHEPQPHPAAPSDIAKNFSHFQEVYESGPHFDPEKLQPFDVAAKEPQTGIGKKAPIPDQEAGGVGVQGEGKAGGQGAAAGGKSSGGSASTSSSGSGQDVYEDLHQLPERFWKTPTMLLDETEMEAIMTGGASLRQR